MEDLYTFWDDSPSSLPEPNVIIPWNSPICRSDSDWPAKHPVRVWRLGRTFVQAYEKLAGIIEMAAPVSKIRSIILGDNGLVGFSYGE